MSSVGGCLLLKSILFFNRKYVNDLRVGLLLLSSKRLPQRVVDRIFNLP